MDGTMAERLRERIARARTQAGVSQSELARVLGIDSTAVSKIEQGKRAVSSTEIMMIAEYSGRPLSWFFEESEALQPHFRGAANTQEARAAVAWLAEFADSYCFLKEALS